MIINQPAPAGALSTLEYISDYQRPQYNGFNYQYQISYFSTQIVLKG